VHCILSKHISNYYNDQTIPQKISLCVSELQNIENNYIWQGSVVSPTMKRKCIMWHRLFINKNAKMPCEERSWHAEKKIS